MDLVSITLNKYLKHRFNGDIKEQGTEIEQATLVQPSSIVSSNMIVTSASDLSAKPIVIQNMSFQKLMPCCVSVRDDCIFLAAGFENSHIYLWSLGSNDGSHQSRTHYSSTETSSDNSSTISIGNKHRLLAHSGSVYCIKFIGNNDLMLSCSEDTTIRLWCLKTKCNLNVYRGHYYPIWSIAVAPLGDYFVSASMDTTARLWRLDKMFPLRIFCGHEEDVEIVEFHPNAKYVATGSADSTVRLWSIADGRMVRLMVGHKGPIISLSFLPNGKFLASASNDGAIKVWNLATNCVTSDLSVPATSSQEIISFTLDQSFVATCSCDDILSIWQVGITDLSRIKEIDFSSQSSKIVQAHFSRSNKLIVVSYEEFVEDDSNSDKTKDTTNV